MEKPSFFAFRPREAAPAGAVIALLCCLWLPVMLPAATVEGLFATQVAVQGRDTAQRNQAIQQAFGKVLVKVSGYRDMPGRPELAGELDQAPRYVQQFRYVAAEKSGEQAAERLQVQFDGDAVTRLLRDKGLPVWGQARPAVLVWLALEDGRGRRWYTPDTDPAGWEALQQAAQERGLPVLLPLLDLEDQANLKPGDILDGAEPTIRAASERYGPDAILVGTLADLGGSWRVRWTLLQEAGTSWAGRPGGLYENLTAGVDRATDALAARYAPLGAESGTRLVELRVAGVLELADYGRVEAHLGSLSMVEQFRLLAVEPGVVRFQLRVAGGGAAVERGIALGGLLEPDSAALAQDAAAEPSSDQPTAAEPASQPAEVVLSYRVRQ
jgi:hypothetical protein